jgi:hypothetical protein
MVIEREMIIKIKVKINLGIVRKMSLLIVGARKIKIKKMKVGTINISQLILKVDGVKRMIIAFK